jgi:redox-sensing transcriptional repressor
MKKVSDSTVGRLSVYLRLLEELNHDGVSALSSEELADHCGTSAAQVRKDLSFFGTFGKRGMGYGVTELIAALRSILGLERRWRVALVGAGKIGAALFAYQDFRRQGFYIESVFDSDITKVGQRWNGLVVRHDAELDDALRRDAVDIAIIAVPADVAQGVVDRVISAGVKAILNFAPTKLRVPEHVALKNVNMALELEGLSYALANSGGVDREQQSRAAAARN